MALGFFSLFKDNQNVVRKDQIYFVSVPDNLPPVDIKKRFSKIAKTFAEKVDSNKVFLNYGKENFIEYDFSI